MMHALYRPLPFVGEVQRYAIEPGWSLAEIAAAVPELPADFAEIGSICINGNPVPAEWWTRVRPRSDARECIVTLHAPLQDSSTLRTVASIAVLIAAVAVSGGALGPAGLGLFGAAFAAGGTGALIGGAAVSVVGSLAIAALIPPPSTAAAAQSASPESFTQGAASLSGNVIAKGRPFPRVVGTRKVFPPLVGQPFVYMTGEDQFVEAIFGLAGPHELEDIRVDGAELSSLSEVEVETREGFATDTALTLIERQTATRTLSLELSRHKILDNSESPTSIDLADQVTPANNVPVWHTVSTKDSPDEFWINLSFVEGLSYDPQGGTLIELPVRLRMRPRGGSSWINLPELHIVSKKMGSFQRSIRLRFGDTVPSPLPVPVTNNDNGFYLAYKVVPGQGTTPPPNPPGDHAILPITAGWTADSAFSLGAGDDVYSSSTSTTTKVTNVALYADRAEIFLPGGTFPKGFWDIQIRSGAALYAATFTLASYDYFSNQGTHGIYDFFEYFTVLGVHRQPSDLVHMRYRMVVDRISDIWREDPAPSRDLALIAIRAKNRSIGQLSTLASGYTSDYVSGTTWNNVITTSNPAPHLRDILTGGLNKNPLPTSLVDNAVLVAWRANCIARGLEVNVVLEGKSVFEAGTVVAAAGMARMRQSEIWDVLIDKDRSAEAVQQIFTPRNSSGLKFEKVFPDLSDGFRVTIMDAAQDYVENEFDVADPLGAGGDVYETMSYDALTDVTLATDRAEFDLKQRRLRMAFYSLTVAAEHLYSRRGDLVGVQNDVLVAMAGFARIKSIVRSGGFITSITLDGTIKTKTATYTPAAIGISVRLTDATVWTKASNVSPSAGDVTVITFGAGVAADPGSTLLDVGCLVATGETGQTYSRMIVFSVTPKDEFTADVVLVDEAPALF